ncbi:MAG: SMC-Scp complex subunit ScpB [Promethearchaeota archaeon]|nr:MAG: SMC-Scp complex subunit ScpB [Candidatus Lokiarchaeota archaeon]
MWRCKLNNFDEDLDDKSEENNEEQLEQELNGESDDDSNEKIDNIPKNQSQESATENNDEEIINNVISKKEIDVQNGLSLKSEISEEELLARQLRDFHRNQIEASLYVAGRPLSIEELSTKLEIPKKEVEELINDIAFDYLDRSTSLMIAQIGDSYQMQIKSEYAEKVSKFAKGGAIAQKYLRTLTIIALKQPILKSLVIKIRGSGAYEHVKYLEDNGLIDSVKKGRSKELTTTNKYSEMFGLPTDKEELKRVMIAQLGLDEITSEPEEEPQELENNEEE